MGKGCHRILEWTPERDKKLLEMRRKGKNKRQIEIALKVSYSKYMKRYKELIKDAQ